MAFRFVKRSFDIICSILILPFFLIIFIAVFIAIKCEDGGSIFYMAERIGKGSKRFLMYKFRSMKENAPEILNSDGSTYNSDDDPRVTKVGKLLRVSSLDETAQILNVLKGEMSLIGPRASGWSALDSYKDDEKPKMNVRPGITGYTQAYYRNSISVREKRLLDAWYAQNASLWLDIKILFKTVETVLFRKNIYTNQSSSIPPQLQAKEISEDKEAQEVK